MRNFNKLVILSLVIYAVLAVFAAGVIQTRQDGRGQSYKVEINRIMGEIEAGMTGTEKVTDVSEMLDRLDLRAYPSVEAVVYLPVSGTDREAAMYFYSGGKGWQGAG